MALGPLKWAGWLSRFGRLPGDIRVVGERTRVYAPITPMLIVSAVLTLALWLVRDGAEEGFVDGAGGA